MSDTITGKIAKILFDVSKNRNIMATIWLDGMDIDLNDGAIYTVRGMHYLQLKEEGDSVTFKKDGSFYNVVVPKEFDAAFNADNVTGKVLRKGYRNFCKGMMNAKFGEQVEISDREIPSLTADFVKDEMFIKDCIVSSIMNDGSAYAKQIVKEMNTKKALQTMNPDDIIDNMARKFSATRLQNHIIVYSNEDSE